MKPLMTRGYPIQSTEKYPVQLLSRGIPAPKMRKWRRNKWSSKLKPITHNVNQIYYTLQDAQPQCRKSSPLQHQLRVAQKLLRKAQQQPAACRRKDAIASIMAACKNNNREEYHSELHSSIGKHSPLT